MEGDALPATGPYRRLVTMMVAATCQDQGVTAAQPAVLETLTECTVSFLKELARSTRAYSDLACRCEPVLGDVVLALVNMGVDVSSLAEYVRRRPKVTLSTPAPSVATKQPSILQVGEKRSHPSHIPDHLPDFPDSHAYVQTPTHKQPITNYEAVREKAASQKRDMERALTRLVAKTGATDQLFDTDEHAQFPVIACRPIINPYLQALDPRDQIFEEEEAYTVRRRAPAAETADDAAAETAGTGHQPPAAEPIDNPYLRPTKMPRKRKL